MRLWIDSDLALATSVGHTNLDDTSRVATDVLLRQCTIRSDVLTGQSRPTIESAAPDDS